MKKRTLKVYAELIEVARVRGVIAYSELAERCGYGKEGGLIVKPLLNEIHKAEVDSGRTGLDALVVRKHDGTPGHGYNEGDVDAWREDVENVYAEWSTLDD